jgi:hypothetical protein
LIFDLVDMVGHPGSMVVVAVLTVMEPASGAVGSHGIALANLYA